MPTTLLMFPPLISSTLLFDLPEQAWGGNGNMSVVDDFLLATAHPNDWGLKERNCCIKSEHSMSATSAKCRSHKI